MLSTISKFLMNQLLKYWNIFKKVLEDVPQFISSTVASCRGFPCFRIPVFFLVNLYFLISSWKLRMFIHNIGYTVDGKNITRNISRQFHWFFLSPFLRSWVWENLRRSPNSYWKMMWTVLVISWRPSVQNFKYFLSLMADN